jgi:hypothetical protein
LKNLEETESDSTAMYVIKIITNLCRIGNEYALDSNTNENPVTECFLKNISLCYLLEEVQLKLGQENKEAIDQLLEIINDDRRGEA